MNQEGTSAGVVIIQIIGGVLASAIISVVAVNVISMAMLVCLNPIAVAGMVTLIGRKGFKKSGSYMLALLGAGFGMLAFVTVVGMFLTAFKANSDVFDEVSSALFESAPIAQLLFLIVPSVFAALAYGSRSTLKLNKRSAFPKRHASGENDGE